MHMGLKNLAAIVAVSLVMGASAASAATFTVVDWSVQTAGNDANVYAPQYGSSTPSGANWSSVAPVDGPPVLVDPTVHVPPGNASGVYQSPFNNTPLVDSRNYFSVGATDGTSGALSPVSLVFGSAIDTFKILWGSIDNYNTLEFFDAAGASILAITGLDIMNEIFGPGPLPNNGPNFEHVALLNITGLGAAAYATFTSTQAAFEFALVPIPAALPLFGAALGGLVLLRIRRNRGSASALPA